MNRTNGEQPENVEEPREREMSESDSDAPEMPEQAQSTDGQSVEETAGAKVPETTVARAEPKPPEMIEKVVAINRITKVTKGGKKLSFSALVVVGDTNGHVGYCLAKAAEVSIAIRKAVAVAKRNMVKIPLRGTTIPHEIIGRCSGSRVLMKPAFDGTGVIAAGAVRAVCDGAGIHNILTKCHRSNNPINVVKATMDGLTRLKGAGDLNQ